MKRKRQPADTHASHTAEDLADIFFTASDLAKVHDIYTCHDFLHSYLNTTQSTPTAVANDDDGNYPPANISLSSMHNLLAELYVDEMLADPLHSTKHRELAVHHSTAALQLWPNNSTAALTLAQLFRENGNLIQALKLYQSVSSRTVPHPEQSSSNDSKDEEDCGDYNWRREFIYAPHHMHCVPVAMCNLAVLLSQLGRHEEADVAIGRIGCTAKIAPEVWQCAHGDEHDSDSSVSVVESPSAASLYPRAIPSKHLQQLQNAFLDKQSYWKQNHYEQQPGYFSWWYDVRQRPSNIVEQLIMNVMMPLVQDQINGSNMHSSSNSSTGSSSIVGAEWWIHKRPRGKNLGHALHWDSDERSVNGVGNVRHPEWSSVCYLSGSGGSISSGRTVVFDARVDDMEYPDKCWVAKPSNNGDVLLFDGELLHGVLPGRRGGGGGRTGNDDTRLTLMVGFWAVDIHAQTGERGGAMSLPRMTRSCTWPNDLKIQESFEGAFEKSQADSKLISSYSSRLVM